MISKWLKDFAQHWTAKDVDGVLSLFSDDVEYWETPYKKIPDKKALSAEWQAILSQKNITLSLEVFSSAGAKHTIVWDLQYTNRYGTAQHWGGTYLVELNSEGKCIYFHQTGERIVS